MSEGTQRRLAAIVSVDVVGYSRLMGVDETGTLNALRSHRAELIDAKIAEHGGRIVKTMGDGLLLEFPSVVEATQCMIEIQSGMAERNRDIEENRRITFRIGVNLGDIIIEGEDIFGDGVNIAARLQEVAQPGGLAISGRVYDDVRDRLKSCFADSGEQSLKNIARPVRVWQWSPVESGSEVSTTADAPLPLPDKPSLAVLPFDNMSDDPEQEYFSDGMSEDIITELSRYRSLFVIARNSSFHYKGQSPNVQNVGRELGVRYIVEGSVRKAGNRVRITAQLVEAKSGNHLWAERYDRNLHDIFAVQDEVTNAIVTAIEPTLGSAERNRAHRKPTERLDAWESYQRGLWNMYRFAAQENTEAQSFFRHAIELDPNFAPAHAGLAYAINLSVALGFGADPATALGEARAAAERAVTLDGDDALAHAVVGRVHMMLGEHDAAISACERARVLNHNLATACLVLGNALIASGRYEEAIVELDEGIRLSPHDPMKWNFLHSKAFAYLAMGRYEEGLVTTRAAQLHPNAGVWAYLNEVVALAHFDRIDEAKQALGRVHSIKPDFDLNFVVSTFRQIRFVDAALHELYFDGLKKAGLEN